MASTRLARDTVTVGDVELELLRGGSGAPVLVLHDAIGSSPDQRYLQLLAEKRDVIVPSHPGFGRSALPDWVDSVEDVAHVYLALVDKLGLASIDLIGCSVGGWIAADMMTKWLDLVGKAVLVGPVGIKIGPTDKLDVPDIFAMPQDKLDRLAYHAPEQHKFDPSSMSDEQLTIHFRNRETLALLTWEPYMHNPKLKHRLGAVTAKTLFVRGESDGLISAAYLEGYSRLVRGSSVMTIPKSGHLPQHEQPEAFSSAVLKFLNV
jgi:pimeloyl-ACP methyl ester carboxylesterase